MKILQKLLAIVLIAAVCLVSPQVLQAQDSIGPPVWAGIFGSRILAVPNPNNSGVDYTMVHHAGNDVASHDALAYSAANGYGFEIIDPGNTNRSGSEQFGPFDNSPNNRGEYDDGLPDQLYDSFIGFKNYATTCDELVVGNADDPCGTAIAVEGGIFRIDVPNGQYRFVGVFGDANNNHAHRVLVQDGGSGDPVGGAGSHVTLVNNHNQASYLGDTNETSKLGAGVFAAVGFEDKLPPVAADAGDTGFLPVFVNMDASGLPLGGVGAGTPSSPVLTVTSGYIRVHLLQGNSNPGPGGNRDANGTDIVLFEVHPVPEPATVALFGLGLVGLVGFGRRRRNG